jgi:DNA repair exonuclease SbcCD ATPase subunit
MDNLSKSWQNSLRSKEGEQTPRSPKQKVGGLLRTLSDDMRKADRPQFDTRSTASGYSIEKREKVGSSRGKSRELGPPENRLKELEKNRELLDNNKSLEEKNRELLDDNRLLKEESQKQQNEIKRLKEQYGKLRINYEEVIDKIVNVEQTIHRLAKSPREDYYLSNVLTTVRQRLEEIQEKLENVPTPDRSGQSTSEEIQRANPSD